MTRSVEVRQLAKRYRIRNVRTGADYNTLRDDLARWFKAPHRWLKGEQAAATQRDFWALRDVSFDINAGEVLGIIGRNGAGKSTLLKVLSRITPPTHGDVALRGRVGSLLEVGTGFHPELTGRENIYLSGAILGMTRREIRRQFDEIVAFAGVETFLETPVKRYSSGMFVRLGFAIAAHLQPDILIVDEVLAVGDLAFRQKCLGKMDSVARSGRTVLFVSHNLGTLRSLCTHGIVLADGQLVADGPIEQATQHYLSLVYSGVAAQSLADRTDRAGNAAARVVSLAVLDAESQPIDRAFTGQQVQIRLTCEAARSGQLLELAIAIYNEGGDKLFHLESTDAGLPLTTASGPRSYSAVIPALPIGEGLYRLDVRLQVNGELADDVYAAGTLQVMAGDFFGAGHASRPQGALAFCPHRWEETVSLAKTNTLTSVD